MNIAIELMIAYKLELKSKLDALEELKAETHIDDIYAHIEFSMIKYNSEMRMIDDAIIAVQEYQEREQGLSNAHYSHN